MQVSRVPTPQFKAIYKAPETSPERLRELVQEALEKGTPFVATGKHTDDRTQEPPISMVFSQLGTEKDAPLIQPGKKDNFILKTQGFPQTLEGPCTRLVLSMEE